MVKARRKTRTREGKRNKGEGKKRGEKGNIINGSFKAGHIKLNDFNATSMTFLVNPLALVNGVR